jgi:hypothetical protein
VVNGRGSGGASPEGRRRRPDREIRVRTGLPSGRGGRRSVGSTNRLRPTLVRLINNLTAQLHTGDLIQMNQRVELEGAKPAAVAADWLRNHPVNR